MKKIIIAVIAIVALAGGSGGLYLYLESSSADPTRALGPAYWGEACGLSPTGFIVCTNEFDVRFESCVVGQTRYRLKVSVTEPRYQPVSLEIWTKTPSTYRRFESGEVYSDGEKSCYHEGYRFTNPDININRGSKCSSEPQLPEELSLMFYVQQQSGDISACVFKNEKPPEKDKK
jgi:hypothetical protein